MSRLKSRGRWFNRQEFYSICSMHFEPEYDCDCCNAGSWSNVYVAKISQGFYKICPPLWRWWANRPDSKSKRDLKKIFPNLE